jgi:peptide deformylase
MKNNFVSKILYYPDRRLLTQCNEVDLKTFSQEKLKSIYNEMVAEIKNIKGFYEGNCVGLSANQIGYNYNIFVVSKFPKSESRKNKVFDFYINPEIIEYSMNQVLKWEGCISDKENLILLKRPELIKLKYTDMKGNIHIDILPQAKSRIIQHEMDHLNGVDFYKLKIYDKVEIKMLDGDSSYFDQWLEKESEREYLI